MKRRWRARRVHFLFDHFSGEIITLIIRFQGKDHTIDSTHVFFVRGVRRTETEMLPLSGMLFMHYWLANSRRKDAGIMLTPLFNVSRFSVLSQFLSCSSGLPLSSHLSSSGPSALPRDVTASPPPLSRQSAASASTENRHLSQIFKMLTCIDCLSFSLLSNQVTICSEKLLHMKTLFLNALFFLVY